MKQKTKKSIILLGYKQIARKNWLWRWKIIYIPVLIMLACFIFQLIYSPSFT